LGFNERNVKILSYVSWKKGDMLPEIVLFGHPSQVKRRAKQPQIWLKEVTIKELKEIELHGRE